MGDDADKVLLDKVPLSWYLGPVKGVESHNYYMAFTDAEHTVSKGRVTLKEAGYLFVADLYAVPGEDAYTLPEGEYMASQLNEDHTFTSQYTGVQYIDAEGNKTQLSLVSGEPLKVSHEGDVWSVSLRFVDTDGSERASSTRDSSRSSISRRTAASTCRRSDATWKWSDSAPPRPITATCSKQVPA